MAERLRFLGFFLPKLTIKRTNSVILENKKYRQLSQPTAGLAISTNSSILLKSVNFRYPIFFRRLICISSLYKLDDLKKEVDSIIERLREELTQLELQKLQRGSLA